MATEVESTRQQMNASKQSETDLPPFFMKSVPLPARSFSAPESWSNPVMNCNSAAVGKFWAQELSRKPDIRQTSKHLSSLDPKPLMLVPPPSL